MVETLVVIVFCAGIFTFLYVSVLPLIGTYNDLITRESNLDIVYKLYNIRLAIQKDNKLKDISGNNFKKIVCSDFKDSDYCTNLMSGMELSNYDLFYTNSIKNNIESFSSYTEVYNYLNKHKEEDNPTLVLIDNDKHTIAHLNYYEFIDSIILADKIKSQVDTTTVINFGNISSNVNGKGVYVLKGTESNSYPIYYYRGEVDNNNVLFGGFCWQMVRTTDTGGIKMVYNGLPTGDGKTCENTEANDRQISASKFNTNSNAMADIGYMYNKRYPSKSGTISSSIYFGSEVSYDDESHKYTLTNASNTKDASHHYSCNLETAAGSCSKVRYYYYNDNYIELTDGEKIEDAIYKMTGNGDSVIKARTVNQNYELNSFNSTIKETIDTWYQNNLESYTNYLEDTVYCNDRSFQKNGNNTLLKSGWNPNSSNISGNGGLSTFIYFNTKTRWSNSSWYSNTNVPDLSCPNETDRFTVSSEKGNGKLKYPIGLLTADEVILAGAPGNSNLYNRQYYLYTGDHYWLLSPHAYYGNYSLGIIMYNTGYLYNFGVYNSYGVRPVVTLKAKTKIAYGGDGTKTNPYVIN